MEKILRHNLGVAIVELGILHVVSFNNCLLRST